MTRTYHEAGRDMAEIICRCDINNNAQSDGFDRQRRQLVDREDPCPNDIIIAVDTSFCNDNRVQQIRQTMRSLINAYSDRQEIGSMNNNLRISLVTFDSDVQIHYGFEQYLERDDTQHLNNLLDYSANLEIQNEVPWLDFDNEIKLCLGD